MDCHAVESFFIRIFHVLVNMWNTFVYVPWTLCSNSPCFWYCLCCNRWLCWSVLILVAIITIILWSLFAITSLVVVILCELLCIFASIGRDSKARCFGNGNPDPGTGPLPSPTFPDPPVSPSPPPVD